VTLNRPDVHNAMNDVMRRELTRCFEGLGDDDDVKVVVVTGAASGVLGGRGHPRVRRAARAREVSRASPPRGLRQAMDRCPQPILAAVNAFAFGGGLELALACDIRIAAPARRWDSPRSTSPSSPAAAARQRLAATGGTRQGARDDPDGARASRPTRRSASASSSAWCRAARR